jgi:hypothetical protein
MARVTEKNLKRIIREEARCVLKEQTVTIDDRVGGHGKSMVQNAIDLIMGVLPGHLDLDNIKKIIIDDELVGATAGDAFVWATRYAEDLRADVHPYIRSEMPVWSAIKSWLSVIPIVGPLIADPSESASKSILVLKDPNTYLSTQWVELVIRTHTKSARPPEEDIETIANIMRGWQLAKVIVHEAEHVNQAARGDMPSRGGGRSKPSWAVNVKSHTGLSGRDANRLQLEREAVSMERRFNRALRGSAQYRSDRRKIIDTITKWNIDAIKIQSASGRDIGSRDDSVAERIFDSLNQNFIFTTGDGTHTMSAHGKALIKDLGDIELVLKTYEEDLKAAYEEHEKHIARPAAGIPSAEVPSWHRKMLDRDFKSTLDNK